MRFSFEVKESDLLGRTGSLRLDGKTLETPYMFPVIHPVSQIISTHELASMGFGGLMTNAYIIHSRRKEEALQKGIHRLLGFDGVFMTDSGGYQALEYGDLELGYREVASFQEGIGSELAVTLDQPTGYPQSRAAAGETVDYSLSNASATLNEFGNRNTVWVGPVQGGLHGDLVEKSAKAMVTAGFQFLALGSPVQVMEHYMFADLARMILSAKKASPYSVPLHLFGAGHPLTMPMAVALGCDTFDSASYVLFARSGRYMSRSGVLTLKTMKYLPCSCPVCANTTVRELLELDHNERTKKLSTHNLHVLKEELEVCKEAISEGRLWDLVEERSMAHPRLRDAFAEMAKHTKELTLGTPAMKDRGLFVRSALDLHRPELSMAESRLKGAMSISSKSARLTKEKAGHHLWREVTGRRADGDAFMVHPVLGCFPSELEFQYPFSQTEVAGIEGTVSLEEASHTLRRLGYRRVSIPERRKVGSRSRRTRRAASPSPRSSSAQSL